MASSTTALDAAVGLAFETRLTRAGAWPLTAERPNLLQLNLGYRCNLHCQHCHLEAGPDRTEEMSPAVLEAALAFAAQAGIAQFDLTGGAPELHPRFRWLVQQIRTRQGDVTDRCNLAILGEPGQEDLVEFFAGQHVRVAASLPHYNREMTDRVRGAGAFDRLIAGLKKLNAAGYGRPGSGLELTLVHSPAGALLPAQQVSLEQEFRAQLERQHGIVFTQLIVITNIPVGRFLKFLERTGNLQPYMARLEQQFNLATLPNLMCRTLLSIGWDGTVYDCDFNQALALPIANGAPLRIHEARLEKLIGRAIRCRNHCYGCTAGQGSSCGGAVAE